MTVSVPPATAGGPPETGASTQRQPLASRRRCAKARQLSTLMVEKSTTSCGALTASATPSLPNIACSTASIVGRLRSTTSAPRAASAAEDATSAPAARASSQRAATMS